MALSRIGVGGTRWGRGCHSIAPAGGCCEVRSGKIFWGSLLLVGGLSLVWLLQGLGHPKNLGHLRASQGPGAPAHPGKNPLSVPAVLKHLKAIVDSAVCWGHAGLCHQRGCWWHWLCPRLQQVGRWGPPELQSHSGDP